MAPAGCSRAHPAGGGRARSAERRRDRGPHSAQRRCRWLVAGVLTPPSSHAAAKAGFREIFDLAALDFPFPVISIVSTRKFIEANPDTVLNVLRAASEAIYLYKTRPELTLPVVAKYMRVPKDDPALLLAQRDQGQFLNQYLTPSPEGIKFVLEFLAEKQPSLKAKNPNDFIDTRFVRKLEEEGFFKKFSTK